MESLAREDNLKERKNRSIEYQNLMKVGADPAMCCVRYSRALISVNTMIIPILANTTQVNPKSKRAEKSDLHR